ncbi:hypothetical protein [Candidatus Lokiarchaeum ossiferum]|uniref:hypothetical protein n=1 Tax=Candidatus Lokiarchaeum ossiferum TaxID=2951803 RepID=UPI00352D281B
MPPTTIRFYCDICKKTVSVALPEDFCNDFKKSADKWPYPLVYPHEGHYAIVYLDEDMKERGVNVSRMVYKEK